jgi:DNA polymerase-2
MEKFVFQIEREEKEKEIELKIYSIDKKAQTKLEKKRIPYQIYAKKKDFEALMIKSDKIVLSDEVFLNKNQEKVVKIDIFSKELYDYLSKKFKEAEFETYESDLPAEHRYLIDYGVSIFKGGKDEIPDLRYICFDIESVGNYDNQEVIMISTHTPYDDDFKKVYVNKEKVEHKKIKTEKKDYEIVYLKDEKELLESFRDDLIEYRPQVILGWNVIDFDFRVIRDRMKFYGLDFNFSAFEGECKLRINKDFFIDSSLNCPGVLVFDVIHLLKSNFINFDDYKLNTVAKEVLGNEKIDILEEEENSFDDKMNAIKNLARNNPLKLIEYNYKDSYLTTQIIEKLSLLKLMVQRSIITNTPLSKVKSPIASLDILYLKELHKLKKVAPTNRNFTDSNQIEGAYVINPKRGFYKDIFVLDFQSLYPSIIMTFNIGPFSHEENGEIEAPNGAKFSKKRGILPDLIERVYKERAIAKKEKNDIKSYALKTTMNSFYGAIASPKSRFYNRDIGGAITSFGRHIIQKAKQYVEERGFKTIYGDTDSVFIKDIQKEFKSYEEKKKRGERIERELNDYFKKWVEEGFAQKNMLDIELEKIYDKFFIASKKRYVGYDKEKDKIQFVGMEAIRGDWTELARSFQVNLVNLIFQEKNKEEIEQYILDYIKKLERGEFDNQLVYRKKITKPLSAYTKTTPPHVRAARELKEFRGRAVKYVMGEEGPKHVSLIDKNFKYDYKHYIEKQLKGVSDDLLESLGIDVDKLFSLRKQRSLDKFF